MHSPILVVYQVIWCAHWGQEEPKLVYTLFYVSLCFFYVFVYIKHRYIFLHAHIVSYLTQVSDLDLASDPEQFVASPPVRYINSGCCVNFSMCLWTPYGGVLWWLKFVPGGVQETQKLEPLQK